MAEDKDAGEKTEEPTQERRMDFRRRGQVAQTKELASVFMLLGSALLMWLLGKYFVTQLIQVFEYSYGETLVSMIRNGDMMPALKFSATKATLLVLPVIGLAGIFGFASSVLQIGFLNSEEALKFKFDRLNPVQGFQRMFSLRGVVEGLKSLVKLMLIIMIVVMLIKSELFTVPYLIQFSIDQMFVFVGGLTLKLFMAIGFFMLAVAALDYGYQKWELEKQMRMTKQEVKEEFRNREGDPLIKARIRKIQREIATRRMMNDVPKADVIITNPTHLAVALKYDNTKYPAPYLVAKGADLIAEKIKNIAREHNIPIVENKPLARTMFKTMKIGQFIPRDLYNAVAEVLAYVYKLKKKVMS